MTRLLTSKSAKNELETSLRDEETQSIVPKKNAGKKSEGESIFSGSLDEVLTWLGWMGPYQRLQCFMLMLPVIDSALHSISFIFIGKFVEHACAPLQEWVSDGNFSYASKSSNFTNPYGTPRLVIDADSCYVTVTNYSKEIFSGDCPNGYTYSEPRERSFVSEWDLVCDEETLSDTSQTVMGVGSMLGAFIFTAMADKLGRKPVYVVSHILLLAIAVATAFSPDFLTFMIFRFILGALQQGVNLTSWILMIELIPTLKREWPPRVSNFVWPSGLLLLGLICYLCREMSWRHTELVLAAISCYALVQWCILDESLRWLTVKGKIGEVERIISKAARRNGLHAQTILDRFRGGGNVSVSINYDVSLTQDPSKANRKNIQDDGMTDVSLGKSDSVTSKLNQETEDDPGFSAFLRNKHILLVTVIICYIWLADSLSYVILIITSDTLTGDFYLGYSLSILVELPAACFFSLFVSRVKRRTWILTAHLIAGISLVLAVVLGNVPLAEKIPGNDVIVLVLSLLAKFGTSVGFNILWLYTPELFPTTIRTTGLGLASLVSKIASMAAPYARTLNRHYPWAPGAVLSGLCLLVPFLIQLMPETHGRALPQTVAEMEMWLAEKPNKRNKRVNEEEEGFENKGFTQI